MNSQVNGIGSLRTRRRVLLGAVLALTATGVAIGAAPATSRGPATTSSRGPATTTSRPATVSAANKAAANTQYLKAKELYDSGKFAEAAVENDKALALDPTHGDATLLKRVLDGKLGVATTGAAAAGGKPGQLTAAQISLVKLAELTNGDRTVRGRVDREVLEEFWNDVYLKNPLAENTSKQAHDQFVNVNNFPLQLRLILESKQQKYMEKVTLTTDPVAIVAFRTGTAAPHNYALQNCATSECHGGEKAGNFRLLTPGAGAASAEIVYTNFYIMSMYAGKDGRMIDRDAPEKSLLLQYSLPWSTAVLKHPKTDIKRIANVQDQRFRQMVEWVKALNLPRPEYGINYGSAHQHPYAHQRP